jgi:HK97 family phage major capsid protein
MSTDLLKSVRRIERRLTELEEKKHPGPTLGAVVRGLAAMHGDALNKQTAAADIAIARALTPGSAPGAYLVPAIQESEISPLLSIRGVLRRAGATVLPLVGVRKVDVPSEHSPVTVEFLAENGQQSPADPDFSQAAMELKTARALFKVSGQIARASVPVFDRLVVGLAARSIARAEDKAFFGGMTSGPTPLMSVAGTTEISQAGGNLAYDDIANLVAAAITAEIDFEQAAFFVNGATFKLISKIKDDQHRPILKPHRDENGVNFSLLGFPLHVTPTIPTIFGSGAASYILFTVPSNILLADGGLEVSLSGHRFFDEEAIGVRVIAPRDFALAQPAGAIILTNVQ